MRISDWSSDVCSSDLRPQSSDDGTGRWVPLHGGRMTTDQINIDDLRERAKTMHARALMHHYGVTGGKMHRMLKKYGIKAATYVRTDRAYSSRSEEHTSELQSLMRISYAVFCLKKK